DLAHKVRRISHAVRTQDYALEEALAEAQGQNSTPPPLAPRAMLDSLAEEAEGEAKGETPSHEVPAIDYVPDAEIGDLVVQLMDATHTLKAALENLHTLVGDTPLTTLTAPWGLYAEEALTSLRTTLELFEA
ncbi:MAG TPA: hypothetical protein PK530_23910, partial [Anaerolineales bacterium]|nr:hypothetical protein [Anaerolineales bacterium]